MMKDVQNRSEFMSSCLLTVRAGLVSPCAFFPKQDEASVKIQFIAPPKLRELKRRWAKQHLISVAEFH